MTLSVLATICLTGLSFTIQSLCFCRDQKSALLTHTSSHSIISEQDQASEDQDRMWAVTGMTVTPAEDLVDINMLDANHGKALGEKGTIFETADGGKSWQRLGGASPTSHFVRISFTNTSIGWAVSWKSRSSSNALVPEYDSLLMQTKDGGRNWTVQYTVKNGSLNQVRFVNEHEGWAVGSTRQTAGHESERILILHTVDQGQHWRDISRNLGKAEFSESAEDIVSNGASKTAILTDRGTILSTDDGGRTWSSKKAAKSERPQFVNLRILADEEDRFWVLSSANSREVIGARLARTDGSSRWTVHDLPRWYVSDVKILSPSRMFVCGFTGEKHSQHAVDQGEGIVAFSSDGGQSWTIIHRTGESAHINALTIVSANELLAVADRGRIFRIYRTALKEGR